MPDYPIPPGNPPLLAGPQFPFSRALSSGPLGDLLAGVAGAPGDFQNLITPRPVSGLPSAGSLAPAQLPTMGMINRAQDQQNATPAPLNFQSLYARLPEMAMLLRGAPTPANLPPWLKDQSWLTNVIGAPGAPPQWAQNIFGPGPNSIPGPQQSVQQAAPTQPQANPQQGWNLEKMFFDLIGGAKPAYGAADDGLPEVDRNASRGPSGPHPQAR